MSIVPRSGLARDTAPGVVEQRDTFFDDSPGLGPEPNPATVGANRDYTTAMKNLRDKVSRSGEPVRAPISDTTITQIFRDNPNDPERAEEQIQRLRDERKPRPSSAKPGTPEFFQQQQTGRVGKRRERTRLESQLNEAIEQRDTETLSRILGDDIRDMPIPFEGDRLVDGDGNFLTPARIRSLGKFKIGQRLKGVDAAEVGRPRRQLTSVRAKKQKPVFQKIEEGVYVDLNKPDAPAIDFSSTVREVRKKGLPKVVFEDGQSFKVYPDGRLELTDTQPTTSSVTSIRVRDENGDITNRPTLVTRTYDPILKRYRTDSHRIYTSDTIAPIEKKGGFLLGVSDDDPKKLVVRKRDGLGDLVEVDNYPKDIAITLKTLNAEAKRATKKGDSTTTTNINVIEPDEDGDGGLAIGVTRVTVFDKDGNWRGTIQVPLPGQKEKLERESAALRESIADAKKSGESVGEEDQDTLDNMDERADQIDAFLEQTGGAKEEVRELQKATAPRPAFIEAGLDKAAVDILAAPLIAAQQENVDAAKAGQPQPNKIDAVMWRKVTAALKWYRENPDSGQ